MLRASPLLLLALALSGCVGDISDPPAGPAGGIEEGPVPFAPAPATLHRLTRQQYLNSLRDLLPEAVTPPTDIEPDSILHGFSSVNSSEITISVRAAEQYEAAAGSAMEQIWGDPARRDGFVGCTVTAAGETCARAFLARFGRLAWRRPLDDEELDELVALATAVGAELGDPERGLGWAFSAILQSPYFLFRVEIGEAAPENGRRYTSLEMASRISYLIWNSTPDDELLEAGERGWLLTEAGLRTQTLRLLESEKANDALTRFFVEFTALDRLAGVAKDATLFPEMTDSMRASMRREVELLFQDVALDSEGDFRRILDTDVTFVNSELAPIYGLPDPGSAELTRARLPYTSERGGLMGRAAMLALLSHATINSPTFRGKFIRMGLLCQDVPPPPPGVRTTIPEPTGAPQTLRQRLDAHRSDRVCASCHEQMDPLGFTLEHFDPIGRWRDLDNGLPIDATGAVDGIPVDGAAELGAALAAHPLVSDCIARRFYRHATGHLELRSEEEAIALLHESFAGSGYRFRELVVSLVLSDGFRRARASR